jgi:uncharacterized protein (DUF302 family)
MMNNETDKPEHASVSHRAIRSRGVLGLLVGLLLGMAVTAGAVWLVMPGLMVVEHESRLDFDATVSALEKAVKAKGWVVRGVADMQKSLAKHGVTFPRRVKVVKLCHPRYAGSVLQTDRQMAALMPCSIAVYEDDDGTVRISKMNTGLLGTMFGGNVARVMGEHVARDEAKMLDGIVRK